MTKPILRAALRSTTAPIVALIWFVPYVIELLNRNAAWRSDWMRTIDVVGSAIDIVGPLLAGAVALDIMRMTSGSAGERFFPHAGRERAYRAVAAIQFAAAALVYVVVLVVTLVISVHYGAVYRGGAAYIAAALIGLAFYATLGLAVARVVPSRLAPVAAVVLAVVGVYELNGIGDYFQVLRFGGATVPLFGLRWVPSYHLAQVVILLILCGIALTPGIVRFTAPHRSLNRRDGFRLAAIVAVLVVAAAFGPTRYYSTVPIEAGGSACLATKPTVCVFEEHRRYLDTMSTAVADVSARLKAAGVDTSELPSQYVERGSRDGRPATAEVELPMSGTAPDTVAGLTPDVLTALTGPPVSCPQLWRPQPPSQTVRVAVTVLAEYVGEVAARGSLARVEFPTSQLLDGISASGRAALATELFTRYKHCDLDRPLQLPKVLARRLPPSR